MAAPGFHYRLAVWASDGRRLVLDANESGHPERSWVQEVSGGPPRAITPEGVRSIFVTVNDSDYMSARDAAGVFRLYPFNGGDSQPVPGIIETDEVVGGTPPANFLYVAPLPRILRMAL